MNHNEIKQRLMKVENVEQTVIAARECGMELSAEEAEKLFNEIQLRKKAEAEPRELDMDELESVSGGSYVPSVCKGDIYATMITFDNQGNIVAIHTDSWCWGGPDWCVWWTETYEDTGIHVG